MNKTQITIENIPYINENILSSVRFDTRGRRIAEIQDIVNYDLFVYDGFIFVFDRYLSDGKTQRFIGVPVPTK